MRCFICGEVVRLYKWILFPRFKRPLPVCKNCFDDMHKLNFKSINRKFDKHIKKYEWGDKVFECECINPKCGYKVNSENHCANIKCPNCGGTMRQSDRPGVGRE